MRSLLLSATVAAVAAVPTLPFRDASSGITFRYPGSWHVSGFSNTNDPRRIAVATYPVRRADVEGDCGGGAAMQRLPRRGVVVLLFDYGAGRQFRPRPRRFALAQRDFAAILDSVR